MKEGNENEVITTKIISNDNLPLFLTKDEIDQQKKSHDD